MGQPADILWFEAVDASDVASVGGKGASLGELMQAGLPVPPGFIVTVSACQAFFKMNRLDQLIRTQLAALDPADSRGLHERAAVLQQAVMDAPLSPALVSDIKTSYQQLVGRPGGAMQVAVRGSTVADPAIGQYAALNVTGNDEVVAAVKAAWASLFDARLLYARAAGIQPAADVTAVVVQAMVQADAAGILFTLDPVTNDASVLTIDAAWGLGEAVVLGALTPDRYVVTKEPLTITNRSVAAQAWKIVRKPGTNQNVHVAIAAEAQRAQKLSDEQILRLAELGKQIEAHYQFPQDTEWALAGNQFFIVQARPITTVTRKVAVRGEGDAAPAGRPLLTGTGASVGIVSGPARILHSATELDRLEAGDILIAELTSPDLAPGIATAAAVVTDQGGRTSHAAIVARELGKPAVVGTGTGTHLIHDGQVVTVDGLNGTVYLGRTELTHQAAAATASKPERRGRTPGEAPKTATKLYVNLAEPDKAAEIAKQGVDGVGLLRAEFMVAGLGEHPKAMVKAGRRAEYVTKLADGLEQFARAFHPHPVVYRGTDFKTNEYRSLKGGDEFEPHEENPMIGYRGAFRYVSDPDLFTAELEALREVRGRRGYDNVWLMIPFVRTVPEFKKVKQLVDASGLTADRTFKLWMMCEVPSNVILIDQFLEAGVQGISIGTNDLTQLTLGADRDNGQLSEEFDERDPAVLWSVERVIQACRAHGATVSVCGQAPSTYPEFAEMLVRKGVTSMSVNPDVISSVRQLIASVERQVGR